MTVLRTPIPVIDLFAGPGGLGEGFSACKNQSGEKAYKRVLSIEMDPLAHATLQLRAFFHQFPHGRAPDAYYERVKGRISEEELFASFPEQASRAKNESWQAELGRTNADEVHSRISNAVPFRGDWVLCGGPPCQAYSVVGRSRRGGIDRNDARVYLYREYLDILARHQPAVFLMENVKGLLSSSVQGRAIFQEILRDLSAPSAATGNGIRAVRYRIHSLACRPKTQTPDGVPQFEPTDFIIRCEEFGIPQARHRVILLGVREDLWDQDVPTLQPFGASVPAAAVLSDLPHIRSGITGVPDSTVAWLRAIEGVLSSGVYRRFRTSPELLEAMSFAIDKARRNSRERGAEYIAVKGKRRPEYGDLWYSDDRLEGVLNHTSRPHMPSDLQRYLFAATYAAHFQRSPELKEFPRTLLPKHQNITMEGKEEYFDDRFRVQLSSRPATTITSHLAKDGHYFIHYDPTQCRSLTVREAARLQTFPDNYFFCGPRTAQYKQVGNAVPPLLAVQIAEIVTRILSTGVRVPDRLVPSLDMASG